MRAVNLIPSEQRESGASLIGRSGGGALAVVVLLAALALLAFMYGSAKHSESKSKSELATVNAELSNARAQAGRLAPYTTFIATANQRVQTVSQLVAARFDWSHSLRELGRVLPRDASLTSLHGLVGASSGPGASSSTPSAPSTGATPASATPPGSVPSFTLSGCATSQSEVAQTLQRLRLIDGVTDVELQSSVKSSSSSGSSPAASGSGGAACPSGTATFAAQISFAGLPSSPPTNAPGTGPTTSAAPSAAAGSAPSTSAGSSPSSAAGSQGTAQVANRSAGR
jgi:Tfp pilus assembly protein PilN